ncbi:SRPBCC family protein [Kribbella qitaiheensis]|uniref:SRPBCC family protein n=1 Tax=Kribbella qitaiheensis TaxID=1544730 RepID=UPI0036076235
MSETLTSEHGRTVLRMERRLTHPPEKVWRALTDPSELAAWFPTAVELDLRLDGKISFTFEQGEDDFVEDPDNSGVIRAYDPPRLLEYTWGAEIQRWELAPTDGGCLLTLTATYDDRPGSASFTSGWILCLDALDKALGGATIQRETYPALHEHFIKQYSLDQGTLHPDGSIHYERQLVAPKQDVWAKLADATPAGFVDNPPPPGFVAEGIEAGRVLTAEAQVELSYPWQHGVVTWRLRDGNGGARLVVTQTGPAEDYLPAWRDLIESLAADLLVGGD